MNTRKKPERVIEQLGHDPAPFYLLDQEDPAIPWPLYFLLCGCVLLTLSELVRNISIPPSQPNGDSTLSTEVEPSWWFWSNQHKQISPNKIFITLNVE